MSSLRGFISTWSKVHLKSTSLTILHKLGIGWMKHISGFHMVALPCSICLPCKQIISNMEVLNSFKSFSEKNSHLITLPFSHSFSLMNSKHLANVNDTSLAASLFWASHFTSKEMEAQWSEIIFPESGSACDNNRQNKDLPTPDLAS